MYNICKYDYVTKKNIIFSSYTDLYTALNSLYYNAISYLQEQDGYEKVKDIENFKSFMYNKKDFRTYLKSTLLPGHYIVRDPDSHVYKLEIWQKRIIKNNGWIYGQYMQEIWRKVFDLDIVETHDNFILEDYSNPIKKEDLDFANDKWKLLNKELVKLDIFSDIKNTTDFGDKIYITELRNTYPNEFCLYSKSKLEYDNNFPPLNIKNKYKKINIYT